MSAGRHPLVQCVSDHVQAANYAAKLVTGTYKCSLSPTSYPFSLLMTRDDVTVELHIS